MTWSKLGRNRQFNLCERINRARALIEGVYADTGSGSQYSEQACEVLEKLFDEQFAILTRPVERNPPLECSHESWEENNGSRRCVDCCIHLPG
jgi:hypothetical protein